DLHALGGQGTTDRSDPEPRAILGDEPTDYRRCGSLSRTKKLVAALSTSMVCSSSRFLRFSSRFSAAMAVVTPSRSPVSISAWRTHRRSASGLIPRRLDTVVIASHWLA